MRESLLRQAGAALVAGAAVVLLMMLEAGLLAGVVAPSPGKARELPGTEIAGAARVVDGDTLVIGDTRVRLEGIDAPEAGQNCGDGRGGTWACGTAATAALSRLIAGGEARCALRGIDKYGRMLAVCFVNGRDINAEMVRQGHARAFVKYSKSYIGEEAIARAERVGIWRGPATAPWDYRAERWATAEPASPNGCAIKGNVNRSGRIYHMPWSPWYDQIRIEPDKGKRWFCDEAEAVAAGWRPAQVH